MFPGNKMFILYVIKVTRLSQFLPCISVDLLVEGIKTQNRNQIMFLFSNQTDEAT